MATKPMKVMVTGATGFIGSFLVQDLAEQGHNVIGTDIVDAAKVADTVPGYIQTDLTDDGAIQDMVAATKPDAIIHLAGFLVEACEADPAMAYRLNVLATISLLDAAVANDVQRFVMTSSPAVFGRGLDEPVPDHAPKVPETIYGQTKLACELLLERYHRTHGLSAGAARFPWVYGPGRKSGLTAEYSSFLFDAIANNQDLVVQNPDQVGDWLFVKDAVRSLTLCLNASSLSPQAYNIMGSAHSVREAVEIAKKVYPDTTVRYLDLEKPNYPYASTFDDARARKDLSWIPSYDLESGVREHVEIVRGTR